MTQDELKALIEDLRLNHEYCPKEIILQAADELEALADHIPDTTKMVSQPEREPVAWRTYIGRGYYIIDPTFEDAQKNWPDKQHQPLYTSPPQRTEPVIDQSAAIRIATTLGWTPPRPWVGLTGEEAMNVTRKEGHELLDFIYEYGTGSEGTEERVVAICKAIEAKLKEKNT